MRPWYRNFGKSSKRYDVPVVTFMAFIHIMAIVALFHFSWSAFTCFLIMYFITACLGITLGYHRLLTHRSFKAPLWVKRLAGFCGLLAMQGGVGRWVAEHRMHHAGSDTDKDPHNASNGFWFSHVGWILGIIPSQFIENERSFARDIYADPVLSFLSKESVMFGAQFGVAGLFYLMGGIEWVLWGVFFRLAWVYHSTWLVNSACHKFGYRPHDSQDLSTNCWWVAVLAFGEGWHNNHHTNPNVCRAGYAWWEYDPTFWVIRGLKKVGLAWDLKEPPLLDQRKAA